MIKRGLHAGLIVYNRAENDILLNAWLTAAFGALFVQTQATIDVGNADPDHNEPEPDAAVTVEPNTAYADRHPVPSTR